MNKVRERCQKDGCAKFFFTAKKMFEELKYIRIFLYLLNIVPVVICFLPSSDTTTKLICSCISFAMTLINEVVNAFLSNYKEKAILEHQLYEAEITGSSFSKIEYDRESTNDLNELAIRKGLPYTKNTKKGFSYPVSDVPQEITDDYSYLYLCRISASKTRFLVSRLFYFYAVALVLIGIIFIGFNFSQQTTGQTIYTLVCFWPLINPLIKNCTACKKCARYCVKICADIDNFFADGDDSVERLARFYYYAQNMEFEMMLTRPIIFKLIQRMFRRGVDVLTHGVTQRFKDAIAELKGRNLILKGVIAPRRKELITKKEYDLEYIQKIKKESKVEKTAKVVPNKEQKKNDASKKSNKEKKKEIAKEKAKVKAQNKQEKKNNKKLESKQKQKEVKVSNKKETKNKAKPKQKVR